VSRDARLSYREFEEMLGEREVELDRTTFYL
jgi:transposase-like protein